MPDPLNSFIHGLTRAHLALGEETRVRLERERRSAVSEHGGDLQDCSAGGNLEGREGMPQGVWRSRYAYLVNDWTPDPVDPVGPAERGAVRGRKDQCSRCFTDPTVTCWPCVLGDVPDDESGDGDDAATAGLGGDDAAVLDGPADGQRCSVCGGYGVRTRGTGWEGNYLGPCGIHLQKRLLAGFRREFDPDEVTPLQAEDFSWSEPAVGHEADHQAVAWVLECAADLLDDLEGDGRPLAGRMRQRAERVRAEGVAGYQADVTRRRQSGGQVPTDGIDSRWTRAVAEHLTPELLDALHAQFPKRDVADERQDPPLHEPSPVDESGASPLGSIKPDPVPDPLAGRNVRGYLRAVDAELLIPAQVYKELQRVVLSGETFGPLPCAFTPRNLPGAPVFGVVLDGGQK